jgi:hypothetical protein
VLQSHVAETKPYRLLRLYPGNRNEDDVRSSVTIETPELPLPLRFYFLRWFDEEDGRLGYEYLGHEFTTGPVSLESLSGADIEHLGPTPEQARLVKENINTYRRMAEHAIANPIDDAGVWTIYRLLRTKALAGRAQGKPWSDEELILVVRAVSAGERLGLSRNEIATELGCERSKLWRALKKARARDIADVPAA